MTIPWNQTRPGVSWATADGLHANVFPDKVKVRDKIVSGWRAEVWKPGNPKPLIRKLRKTESSAKAAIDAFLGRATNGVLENGKP